MEFEILTEQSFNRNFGDFTKCESSWKKIDEMVVNLLLYAKYKGDDSLIKEEIEKGKVVTSFVGYIRKKTNLEKCSLCAGSIERGMHSISIVDNKTKICPDCGTREQLERFTGSYDR